MKALMIAIVGAATAFAAVAETNATSVVRNAPTARKTKAALMKRFGGYVVRPNSARGAFVFMNAQKRVDKKVVEGVAAKVLDMLHITTAVADVNPIAFADMNKAIDEAKCRAGLIVVDDPKLPMLLVAPEGRWAYVNVSPLAAGDADKAKVEKRLTQELWRGFCYVGGGSPTESQGCVMNPAFSVGSLDAMPWDMISLEPVSQIMSHFKRMGITPAEITTYRQACLDGWAPQPTNDFQKAIWDKVHELPTKPITIEPESKPQKK